MLKRKNWCVFALVFVLTLSLVTGCGSSPKAPEPKKEEPKKPEFTIKFAHVVRPTIAKGQAADMFAKKIEEKTNGRIKVEVYPDSQLGTDQEITEQMQLGTIQMNAPFTGVLPTFVPLFQVFDLPFLFADKKEAYEAMHGKVGEVLNKHLEQKGLKALGYWDGGFKHFTNSKRPIEKPADMKDLKMRASQSPLLIAQFRALGAGGISIPFAELYTALQNKTVDGQENTLANIATRKFYEVQDYMTLSNHGYMGYVLLISDSFYKKLPADLQKAVNEVAAEVTKWAWEAAEKDDQKYLAELKASKMKITELTPENRKAFLDATKSVYEEFRKIEGGKELIEAIEAMRKK